MDESIAPRKVTLKGKTTQVPDKSQLKIKTGIKSGASNTIGWFAGSPGTLWQSIWNLNRPGGSPVQSWRNLVTWVFSQNTQWIDQLPQGLAWRVEQWIAQNPWQPGDNTGGQIGQP